MIEFKWNSENFPVLLLILALFCTWPRWGQRGSVRLGYLSEVSQTKVSELRFKLLLSDSKAACLSTTNVIINLSQIVYIFFYVGKNASHEIYPWKIFKCKMQYCWPETLSHSTWAEVIPLAQQKLYTHRKTSPDFHLPQTLANTSLLSALNLTTL